MRSLERLAIGVMLLGAPLAFGATVSGTVAITSRGEKKADRSLVVIFVGDQPLPKSPPTTVEMAQRGRAFTPAVVVVPVGGTVRFTNYHRIEHNVFSRSPHQSFDLGRYGRGEGKEVHFTEPGVVDVFCNVHSNMIGHVLVVPGPFAITDASGHFAIHGVAPGDHTLVVWDRLATPALLRRHITVGAAGSDAIDIALTEPADVEAPHPNKFGGRYPPEKRY
ncbi:MAG: plastocyanin/azurin family copper-binding protein [Deltaproteobacteria bacterium]